MARTKATKAKAKQGQEDAQSEVVISKASIKALIENRMYAQRQDYIEGLYLEGPAGTGEGLAPVVEAIGTATWLEAEHVDGILRGLISEREYLHNSVGVFPAFNKDDIARCVENEGLNQVLAKTKLPTRQAPDGNTVLLREPLPEVKGLFKRKLDAVRGNQQGVAKAKDELNDAFKKYYDAYEQALRFYWATNTGKDTPFIQPESLLDSARAMQDIINKIRAKAPKEALSKILTDGLGEVEAYFRGANERLVEEQAFRAQAQDALRKNSITEDNYLELFLESMVESRHNFLGRPQANNLGFDNCSQVIIPFRKNGNHYTVAVVQCQNAAQKTATIKYYDSKGDDLPESEKTQLRNYFTQRGFNTTYQCISANDQNADGYNCGIFASFKALDIANQNAGKEERFLADLSRHNYEYRLNYYRYLSVLKLLQQRFNVSVGQSLSTFMQNEFDKHVPFTRNMKELLTAANQSLASALDKVATADEKSQREPVHADASTEVLLQRYIDLKNEARALLKARQQARKSAKTDREIKLLTDALKNFEQTMRFLETQIHILLREKMKQDPSLSSSIKELSASVQGWLNDFNIRKALLYSTLAVVGFVFGYPFLLASMIKIGAFFPTNPLYIILVGGLGFVGTIELLNFVGEKIFGNNESTPPAIGTTEDPNPAVSGGDGHKQTAQPEPGASVDNPLEVDAAAKRSEVVDDVLSEPSKRMTRAYDQVRRQPAANQDEEKPAETAVSEDKASRRRVVGARK